MKLNLEKITKIYLIIFSILIIIYNSIYQPRPRGEWDDYSLPVASILNNHSFGIDKNDVTAYKTMFPELAQYIDEYKLSGRYTKEGKELTWYFPTYAIASIPMYYILKFLQLPTAYAFIYTNILVLMLALIVIFKFLNVTKAKKLLLVALLSVNPIVFYIGWMSGEVLIYSLLVISLVFWYNGAYKRAAVFVSIAGTLNPTILSVGFIMIGEYLLKLWHDNKGKKLFNKEMLRNLTQYGSCYIIGLIPLAYNYYHTGYINMTASDSRFLAGKETTLQRFWAYLWDLNYGIFPYFPIILLLATCLLVIAIFRKQWRYIEWLATFAMLAILYSIMVHINHGMSGIARYNAWGSTILIFAVLLYYDNIVHNDKFKKYIDKSIWLNVIISLVIIYNYNPYRAQKVSDRYFTPIAQYILDKYPYLYNPLYSTFNNRTNHLNGGYGNTTPIIYVDENGYVRKILATKNDISELRQQLEINEWLENKINQLSVKKEYISVPTKYQIDKKTSYTLGTIISFAEKNNYMKKGFSGSEKWGTWTDGDTVIMRFKINSPKEIVHAAIDSIVFNKRQTVQIIANDKTVYHRSITQGPIEFDIPNNKEGKIDIEISLPNAISPKELGASSDSRKLGLGFKTMVID